MTDENTSTEASEAADWNSTDDLFDGDTSHDDTTGDAGDAGDDPELTVDQIEQLYREKTGLEPWPELSAAQKAEADAAAETRKAVARWLGTDENMSFTEFAILASRQEAERRAAARALDAELDGSDAEPEPFSFASLSKADFEALLKAAMTGELPPPTTGMPYASLSELARRYATPPTDEQVN
jgi:hypothetical protein